MSGQQFAPPPPRPLCSQMLRLWGMQICRKLDALSLEPPPPRLTPPVLGTRATETSPLSSILSEPNCLRDRIRLVAVTSQHGPRPPFWGPPFLWSNVKSQECESIVCGKTTKEGLVHASKICFCPSLPVTVLASGVRANLLGL